jgi:signal transduction histidine kinase/ActR/RegA family two-component response regulator
MPRNTEVFGPTFRGEGVIRSDDITRDPRYGRNHPHRGMPAGHLPVRSYLAVPVKSRSGEVLGGLFFGHQEPAMFTTQAETIVVGLAAQAAVAIDNATLYRQVQRLLEQERQAREEAERVSRMKDEFLATLSHELRTPLNAVLGWGHMLVRGLLPADRRDAALESVLRNARIQSQLIDELLDMSRIISGRVRMDMARLELRATVDAALDAVRPTAAAKGVVLSLVDDGQSHPVWGDPGRLQQVIWNLLTNAVKFTDTGGGIIVGLRRLASEVEVSVSDTGTGIAAEFLPHVFDRFRQADASTTRAHGGLGLGLSIARSLVEMHAGRIRAESAGVGKGATFTVTLPLAAGAGTPIAGNSTEVADASDVPARLSGLSILVVDDDADSRDLAAEALRQHGADVRTAASGREALDLVGGNGHHFAVVVSDIGMPGMDGYMFLRELRAVWPSPAPLRAIALTAYAGAEEEARAADAGYDHHLAKPFVPADLVHAVSRLTHQAPEPPARA